MCISISIKKKAPFIKNKEEGFLKKSFLIDSVMRIYLYLLVFLLPLFFLPFTSDPFEFNKVIVLGILSLIACFLYLLKIIIRKEAQITKTFLDWPVLAWLIIYLLATIFSFSRYNSLVGINGYYSDSLITIFFFILLFYLVVNNIKGAKEIFKIFAVLFMASVILIIYNFLQISKIYILPFDLTKTAAFNLMANSTNTLSIFLSIVCLFIFGFILLSKVRWYKIILIVAFIINFIFLIVIDRDIGWYVLMVGLFSFLILVALRSREINPYVIILPSVLLALSVLFLFINTASLFNVNLSNDALLQQKTSWQISQGVINHRPWLGTGPQTFNYSFENYRPADFNNSDIWNLRFIKSGNTFFQIFSNVGFLGLLAFLAISFWYLFNIIMVVVKARQVDQNWFLTSLIVSGWVALLVISFFYPLNFILFFLWWLFLALSIVAMPSGKVKVNTYNFGQPPLFTVVISFIFILIIAGTILFIYFAGRVWLADVNYVKALKARDKTENIAKVKGYLEKAIKFNSYASDYHFVLAQALATEAQLEATKEKPDINAVQNLSQKSIDESKVGVERDSKNPIVYENQASIFSSLRNLLGNADQRAAEAYEKAVALEPNNSIVYLNLGRSYLLYAQSLLTKPNASQENKTEADSNLDFAITNFKKADSLKKDLPDARYNWALALELKGNLDEAFSLMEKLVSDYPSNVDVIYALGQMYERNNKLDQAIAIFNRIITSQPNHSNSHWQLGLIYEQQGDEDKAIAEFETVQKLNPDNETVKQKLDDLKNPKKK